MGSAEALVYACGLAHGLGGRWRAPDQLRGPVIDSLSRKQRRTGQLYPVTICSCGRPAGSHRPAFPR